MPALRTSEVERKRPSEEEEQAKVRARQHQVGACGARRTDPHAAYGACAWAWTQIQNDLVVLTKRLSHLNDSIARKVRLIPSD